ncbi:MAG: capsular biosynthesis protein [Bacteroidia bacterium]|nr:capsular biosynthesis protein [Lachnospiraceae bacterium]NCC11084.1 capsular biosynthesis protein [Bacteroidia bacterium]
MLKLTDMHCHLIPGVDDGAADERTAKQMLQMEYADGVRRIIATPHYRRGMFETPMETILKQFKVLQDLAAQVADDLQVELGCEYHSHLEMTEAMLVHERPTLASSPYVLVEFSSRHTYRNLWNQVCSLQQEGFEPIIAHIERYPCLREHPERLHDLADQGIFLQVNAGSILGEDGMGVKRFCKRLLQEELIDFVASDAHDTDKRRPNLGKCAEYVTKKMGSNYAQQLFQKNPAKIGV